MWCLFIFKEIMLAFLFSCAKLTRQARVTSCLSLAASIICIYMKTVLCALHTLVHNFLVTFFWVSLKTVLFHPASFLIAAPMIQVAGHLTSRLGGVKEIWNLLKKFRQEVEVVIFNSSSSNRLRNPSA